MNSPDTIRVGKVGGSRLSNQVVRIVHISDTHLQHTTLSPPRPISGNISIRRSINNSSTNQIVDEVGFDAFERRSLSLHRQSIGKETDSISSSSFHKGGTFLSGASSSSRGNPNEIPCGDVLVHSGDFDWTKESGGFFRSDNFEEIVQVMNDFFDRFPHKVKLFVAGNHEVSLDGKKIQTVQERLTSAVYLLNSSYTYEGVHFYGAPYTPFRLLTNARGFIRSASKLALHWREIPDSVDVLITHSPPFGILDLGTTVFSRKLPKLSGTLRRLTEDSRCASCYVTHPGRNHWGCPILRDEVLNRIKQESGMQSCAGLGKLYNVIGRHNFCPGCLSFDLLYMKRQSYPFTAWVNRSPGGALLVVGPAHQFYTSLATCMRTAASALFKERLSVIQLL